MARLEVHNLKKIYTTRFGGNQVQALSDVSFDLESGEFVAVMGESGSGKTTLLNILAALDRPTSGTVTVDGKDIFALKDEALTIFRRRKIGFVFQNYNLLPKTTAIENVELPLMYNSSVSAAERYSRAVEALKAVGLGDRLMHKSNQMSGGQMQRVAIARALASDPEVLLCDEATSALDPMTTQSILKLLQDINRELGITMVVITHEMAVIRQICTHVAILDGGVIAEEGTPQQIFEDPQNERTKDFLSKVIHVI